MPELDLYLKSPLSPERFEAVARAIFGQDLSDVSVTPDINVELTKEERKKNKGIVQCIYEGDFETCIMTTEENEIDHIEMARLFATVGGVEALVLDVTETTGRFEVDRDTHPLAPWLLFEPDGTMHRARIDPYDWDTPESEREKPFHEKIHLLD